MKIVRRFLAPSAIACSIVLSGCNANNVSSMLNTVTQVQSGFNQGSTVNSAALLAGMDQKTKTLVMQKQLAMLGYNIGTPDGVAGPQTRRAVRQYQAANGLSQTGQFDMATSNALMAQLSNSARQPGNSDAALIFSQLQQLQGSGSGMNGSDMDKASALLEVFNTLSQ